VAEAPAIQQQARTMLEAPAGKPSTSAVAWESFVNDNGLIMVPASIEQWIERWGAVNPGGVVITVLLLSLGAPFWYSVLGRLLRLRSALAAKDDVQRAARQQPLGVAGGAPAAAVAAGERGDLLASG
jgi:hypothetical protein